MNQFYDISKAREDLESYTQSRVSRENSAGHKQYLLNADLNSFNVVRMNHPVMWKLVDREGEEVVLRVPGILCLKELPPISVPTDSVASRRARRYMRQQVKLSGMGDSLFENTIDIIHEIFIKFSSYFDETSLEQWLPDFHDTFTALQASARYFTPVSMVHGSGQVPFAPFVDPDGCLLQAMGSEYVHTAENRVDYYQRSVDPYGKASYHAVDPVTFKVGDIVEAGIAFAVVPSNPHNIIHGKKKLILSLRGLALIDSDQRNKAAIREMRERVSRLRLGQLPIRYGKRAVGFADDDEPDSATTQLKRMRLSDDEITQSMDVTI